MSGCDVTWGYVGFFFGTIAVWVIAIAVMNWRFNR